MLLTAVDSDECPRSPAYPVAALAITTELTLPWAPSLHQCAVLFPRIAATLDHVPTCRVGGHRNVRDERLILANVVRKHPHYHLEPEHDSCEPKARRRQNEAFGTERMGWSRGWCEEQWHSMCTTPFGQNAQFHEAQPFLTAHQLAKVPIFKGTRRFISAITTFTVSTQKALNTIQQNPNHNIHTILRCAIWVVPSEVCHPRCALKLYGEVNSVTEHNYKIWLNDGVH